MRARIVFLEELLSNHRNTLLSMLLVLTAVFVACSGEEEYAEPEAFSFVVYPGSRYMGQLTENIKSAHRCRTRRWEAVPATGRSPGAPT